jgi:hypothetical protein
MKTLETDRKDAFKDANIFGHPALANTDRSAVWLADLIKATEVVGTSAEPCDPVLVTAFSYRLEMPADRGALVEGARRGIRT